MLKVKIEEKYLKSFEWFLQCYQYLFYYDSGAEVSCNIIPPAGTWYYAVLAVLIPHESEDSWFLTLILAIFRFKSSRRIKSMGICCCRRLINTFPHHLSFRDTQTTTHVSLILLWGLKVCCRIVLSIYLEIVWI